MRFISQHNWNAFEIMTFWNKKFRLYLDIWTLSEQLSLLWKTFKNCDASWSRARIRKAKLGWGTKALASGIHVLSQRKGNQNYQCLVTQSPKNPFLLILCKLDILWYEYMRGMKKFLYFNYISKRIYEIDFKW